MTETQANSELLAVAIHRIGKRALPATIFSLRSQAEKDHLLSLGAIRELTDIERSALGVPETPVAPPVVVEPIVVPAVAEPVVPPVEEAKVVSPPDLDGDGKPGGSLPLMKPKHVGAGKWAVIAGAEVLSERFDGKDAAQDWIDAQVATVDQEAEAAPAADDTPPAGGADEDLI